MRKVNEAAAAAAAASENLFHPKSNQQPTKWTNNK